MSRRSAAILAALSLLVFASTAYAAAPAKPTPPKTVSLELTDTTVVEALESLFKGTNLSYITEPGVGGVISSLRLKNVSFNTALNAIVKAAGLEANVEDGVYIIGKPEPAPAPAVAAAPAAEGTNNPESATANPADTQNPDGGQSLADNTQPAPEPYPGYQYGPQPPPSPVFYGNYPPGYYGYGPAYGYGYAPTYGYGYPRVYVPGYQRGSVMLPGPGGIFSTGIGRAKITPAPNYLAPLGQ